MVDLLILTAMVSEFSAVCRSLGRGRRLLEEYRAQLNDVGTRSIAVMQMGIGPERARKATLWGIRTFEPRQVLMFGVAGGLHPELQRTDVVWGTSVLSDRGVAESLDPGPMQALAGQSELLRHHAGSIFQSARVIAERSEKQRLHSEYGALGVDMESLAVVQACRRAEVPVAVVRIIVDTAQDELPPEISELMSEEGNPLLGRVFARVLRRPRLLKELLAMEQQNRLVVAAMREWGRGLRQGLLGESADQTE